MFGAPLDKSCRSNLVHVGTVVVLTTSQTTTTGMLAVLAYTTLSMGNVAAAVIRERFVSLPSSSCEIFAACALQRAPRRRDTRSPATQEIIKSYSDGFINVLLAGLRSSGRHGDGCGVVASPMCCVEGLEVGGGVFAAGGFGTARPRKIVRREGSTALSPIVRVFSGHDKPLSRIAAAAPPITI